jgi:hypothetical protein
MSMRKRSQLVRKRRSARFGRAYTCISELNIQRLVIYEHFSAGWDNLCPIKKQGNGLDLGLLHVENLKASKDGVEVDEEPWCKMGSIMKVLKTKRRD